MVLFVALALSIAVPTPSHAAAQQEHPPQETVRQDLGRTDEGDLSYLPELSAGFDGLAKAGRWLTVRAVVANAGPLLDGELRLSMRTGGEVAVYTQPIQVAQRARKLATFQVPGSIGQPDLRLTLRANDVDLVSRDVPLRILGPTEFLVGVLADDKLVPTGLAAVRRGGNPVAVAHLTGVDLPTDPIPFQAMDALVIRQAATDRLTPTQRAALRTWVEQGGQLVVAGGPGWRRSVDGLDELLPVFGLWTRPVKHLRGFVRYAGSAPPDGDVLVTIGSPIAGARVLLSQESIPLLVERWLGLGRVTFIGIDPALEPFRSWPAAESLWQRILVGGRPGMPILDDSQAGTVPLRAALGEMLDLGLPPAGWIIGFLLGYVVIAGPGQYVLLRRLDRREWAWIGFPAVAVLAAGLLLGSAWWLRGPDVRLASVSVVRVAEDTQTAPLDTYLGLVAPTRGTFDLTFPDGPILRPIGNANGGTSLVFATGQDATLLPELRLEGRSVQTLQSRSMGPALMPVQADLKTTNGRLEGTVRNVGPSILEDVMVIAAGEGVSLGDLAPGDTKSVSISLPTNRAAGAWQNGTPPWTVPGTSPGVDRQRALISQIVEPWRGRTGDSHGGATLFAWTSATLPRIILHEEQVPGQSRQLIAQALPVNYGREDVAIPPGLLPREVLDGTVLDRSGTGQFVTRSPLVFQFDLPPGLEFARIDRLSVHLALPPYAGPSGVAGNGRVPRLSLYRWADRTWVDVPLTGTGVANMPFGVSFVDGGAIRLRLEPQGNEQQVDQVDLSLEGVRQ
ncbi:MAG: hypothetical protein AB7P40_07780 [Chloroflexota bacterium]